ncbi:centrosomal protein [Chloropicon primus]|uniref:Centrosomal protein n=1 Tax=Chloropicon primus TaxID=1764295 RepID=A0A5B8MNK5_9CHLO|nr:centrosomal protein [Chloropicon primus]|eukprot:QDZ21881.1 centrosomal protein [Chloropicon primus]
MKENTLDALRKQVISKLDELGVRAQIEDIITKARDDENLSEVDMFRHLEEKGIIANVTRALNLDASQTSNKSGLDTALLRAKQKHLHIRVSKGRGFTEYVTKNKRSSEKLRTSVTFGGRLVHSALVPCTVEPFFNIDLLVPILKGRRGATVADLLKKEEGKVRVTVCVVSMDDKDYPIDSRVMGHCELDYREAIVSSKGYVRKLLQLEQGEPTSTLVPGAIDLTLRVVPALSDPIDKVEYNRQIREEEMARTNKFTNFLNLAKTSWNEFINKSEYFKQRPTKLIAYGEDGLQHCSCEFLKPLKCGRVLRTPKQAAYWVSLLQEDTMSQMLGDVSSRWSSFDTIAAKGSAKNEEKALLLCSFLLGFGLDAYVCYGYDKQNRVHSWVMTLMKNESTAMFWEALNASCYSIYDCPYANIGCVFNDHVIYLNSQDDHSIEKTAFDLGSSDLWMPVHYSKAGGITLHPFPLAKASLDGEEEEELLEDRLRVEIEAFRAEKGLEDTLWDENLEHVLAQALVAYETEACTGQAAPGNMEFQHSVKRMVPIGYTFRGVPMQFKHRSSKRILRQLLEETSTLDIILSGSQNTVLALSAHVNVYPNDLSSTWIMVASRTPK